MNVPLNDSIMVNLNKATVAINPPSSKQPRTFLSFHTPLHIHTYALVVAEALTVDVHEWMAHLGLKYIFALLTPLYPLDTGWSRTSKASVLYSLTLLPHQVQIITAN